ncbi:MAG: hypothetical protein OXH96_25070 [Spirochaetaceae bacterium]|nr:hypothetical protein [Spirochaetaceae bacterium]
MPFKAGTSFLRFLSMGAAGVHRTMETLRRSGFEPIELERYCGSNKIWSTKIKRLRLSDLLCVRTGLRVEVRAKTDLKIRMSDTPSNRDRAWDAGLRDDDLVAFIYCSFQNHRPIPADQPVFLSVGALRSSIAASTVGPPKSASEGAERDRTWPATVPSRDGTVLEVTDNRIITQMDADRTRAARRQTYLLRGKTPYVAPGQEFRAHSQIICGAPRSLADLSDFLNHDYDPMAALESDSVVDRYAAVKALAHRPELGASRITLLENMLDHESDDRVLLEAAAVAALIGSSHGEDRLSSFIWADHRRPDLRMETVIILTELGNTPFARDQLMQIAGSDRFQGDELRQAAVWGLGKMGLKRYEDLLGFIDDSDDDVALHAIAGFDHNTPPNIINSLVSDLATSGERRCAAASAALAAIGSDAAITALASVARVATNDWTIATIGSMPPERVRSLLVRDDLLRLVSPLLVKAEGANWLASEEKRKDLRFLQAQDIASDHL